MQLGELVLQQSRDYRVEGGAEVHKQDPSVGSCCVQVLEEEVKGHVDSVVHRPVGSVGELQGVQEGSVMDLMWDKALKGFHNHRGQGHGSVVI